jgi:hypothetical protein
VHNFKVLRLLNPQGTLPEVVMRFWLKSRAWGLRGRNPAFKHSEHSVPPSPDEMFETITPTRRANTLDPEVRNPALKGRGGVISYRNPLS